MSIDKKSKKQKLDRKVENYNKTHYFTYKKYRNMHPEKTQKKHETCKDIILNTY